MGVDAHANSKYLNWFLDSCLSWNWTISCALFAIEKLTLELFSIILGLKIWSCNFFQRLRFTVSPYTCYWKFCCFDITNRESLWMFSNSESSSLVLWFSGSLVLWFILVLQNAFKEKNLFWLVGAVKYYFANLSINECSISKRYITLHINGWQQPVESVRDLGGRLVVGWSGSRTDQRQPEAATLSYSKASHGERCKLGSWPFFCDVTFFILLFLKK